MSINSIEKNILIVLLCCLFVSQISANQATCVLFLYNTSYNISVVDTIDNISSPDTLINSDTVLVDSINKPPKSSFEYPIDLTAEDSMVIYGSGTVVLYKGGKIVYKEPKVKEVEADFIRVNADSNYFHARGVEDTLGNKVGLPIFKDGGESYEADEINYNFKTERGFIRGARTQEGEGFIIADKTKKTADGYMNMKGGKYTTCDILDNPHFYLKLTKGRVKPNGYVVAGPAYMVVEDLPLPLVVPFGFFPFNSRYSSGIIMPSYGDELQAGFFLKGGGYYFAINDYVDLALTGDIYTKGSWGVQLASQYRKRYRYDGKISIKYNAVVRGEKDLPDYKVSKDFRVDWNHRQDPKASAFSTFSASVNFFTSGYNRNSIDYNYNPAEQSQAETSSAINFTQRVPGAPISFSINASVRQSVRDSSINLTLPTFRMDVSTIYLFRKKNRVGKEKFYEKFSFSYAMEFANSFYGKENRVFKSNFATEWQNGIKHSPKIQMPITLFKYINIVPQVSYTERWYFKKVDQSWDMVNQAVNYDTISGFYRAYDFSTGISVATTLYGFYSPVKKIKDALGIGDIRHMFKPSISYMYTPDFSDPMWKMYKTYTQERVNPSTGEVTYKDITYSPFAGGKYGVPGRGENQRLSISLDNNIEMKVKDKAASDTTTSTVYKKISIIDNLNIRGGYNFAADSLNMDNIAASLRIKITKSYSITLSTYFEPYMYALNSDSLPVKVNEYRWKHGKAPWFSGTSTNFSYTIDNNTFKKKSKLKPDNTQQATEETLDEMGNPQDDYSLDPSENQDKESEDKDKSSKFDNDGYTKPHIPWSISFNFGIGWGKTNEFDFKKMEYKRNFNGGVLGVSGYINPSPNWQFSYSTSIALLDKVRINSMSMNIKRNLHCWSLTASVTPFGYYKSFMVTIGANASMLRDLKYDKRKRDNVEIK